MIALRCADYKAESHYLPDTSIKLSIINFAITLPLEEQLLVDVVQQERPDLEKKGQASSLTADEGSDETEDKVLSARTSTGHFTTRISSKTNLQRLSLTKTGLRGGKDKERDHCDERAYRPVATRGSGILAITLLDQLTACIILLGYFQKLY